MQSNVYREKAYAYCLYPCRILLNEVNCQVFSGKVEEGLAIHLHKSNLAETALPLFQFLIKARTHTHMHAHAHTQAQGCCVIQGQLSVNRSLKNKGRWL